MTTLSVDDRNRWLAHEPIDRVRFTHDDLVTILSGEHSGMVGSLVSIEQIEPEVLFRIEVDSGFEIVVNQTDIELVG
ncbi:MAG TPA: hypothetical protein VK660_08190 [Xanthomonadaceae bacterium]|jgi:hypothetical protein|nr:hypothetical protein [Xanthomonadaceae bacterium]